jgi:hypothetical protein
MPKFVIQAEETLLMEYVVEAENEDAAREAFFETTVAGTGRLVKVESSCIQTIDLIEGEVAAHQSTEYREIPPTSPLEVAFVVEADDGEAQPEPEKPDFMAITREIVGGGWSR